MKFYKIAIIAVIFILLTIYVGTAYGYNLTKADIEEGRVLQICIHTEIYLEYCETIYGGNGYGEPLKK